MGSSASALSNDNSAGSGKRSTEHVIDNFAIRVQMTASPVTHRSCSPLSMATERASNDDSFKVCMGISIRSNISPDDWNGIDRCMGWKEG